MSRLAPEMHTRTRLQISHRHFRGFPAYVAAIGVIGDPTMTGRMGAFRGSHGGPSLGVVDAWKFTNARRRMLLFRRLGCFSAKGITRPSLHIVPNRQSFRPRMPRPRHIQHILCNETTSFFGEFCSEKDRREQAFRRHPNTLLGSRGHGFHQEGPLRLHIGDEGPPIHYAFKNCCSFSERG